MPRRRVRVPFRHQDAVVRRRPWLKHIKWGSAGLQVIVSDDPARPPFEVEDSIEGKDFLFFKWKDGDTLQSDLMRCDPPIFHDWARPQESIKCFGSFWKDFNDVPLHRP